MPTDHQVHRAPGVALIVVADGGVVVLQGFSLCNSAGAAEELWGSVWGLCANTPHGKLSTFHFNGRKTNYLQNKNTQEEPESAITKRQQLLAARNGCCFYVLQNQKEEEKRMQDPLGGRCVEGSARFRDVLVRCALLACLQDLWWFVWSVHAPLWGSGKQVCTSQSPITLDGT